mmetsp:Transcript_39980/g.125111  ORF Transcript_39980/g.125111 Transcript_39980/m.125111 type:complete len:200 (+) Transcript_39980:877-1476(+)
MARGARLGVLFGLFHRSRSVKYIHRPSHPGVLHGHEVAAIFHSDEARLHLLRVVPAAGADLPNPARALLKLLLELRVQREAPARAVAAADVGFPEVVEALHESLKLQVRALGEDVVDFSVGIRRRAEAPPHAPPAIRRLDVRGGAGLHANGLDAHDCGAPPPRRLDLRRRHGFLHRCAIAEGGGIRKVCRGANGAERCL